MKTSELTGAALDWAVAACEGLDYFEPDIGPMEPEYSSDWSQGGPIIERENIQIGKGCNSGSWCANQIGSGHAWITAATPLIAAMRCYVASKLGDEVDVPAELEG